MSFSTPRPLVVVPVDFSAPSAAALRYGAHLAERAGAELHVLHVHRPGEAPGDARESKSRLADFAREAGVPVAGSVLAEREGDHAAEGIVAYAEEVEADLVVMSRVGARGWRRYLIGSQTDEVLRTIRCTLLVVPETLTTQPRVHHLLVPVDLTAVSGPLVRAARDFAARYGDAARLTVLHALEPLPHAGGWMSGLAFDMDESLGNSIAAEVQAMADGAGGTDVPTEVRITEGKAAEAILREADTLDADLLVMASDGRGDTERFLMGSTTERIVRTTDRPVLVVRSA